MVSNQVLFHPELCEKLSNVAKTQSALNMIFYGPPGSGKHNLVLHFLKIMYGKNEEPYEYKDEALNIRYKSTSHYIIIDGYEWKHAKINIQSFIEEITQTHNVASGNFKTVYIRYIDVMSTTQHLLRQLVEDTYKMCRFIFSTRNLDLLDPALVSRCVEVRVPAPSPIILSHWLNAENCDTKLQTYAHLNANVAYHLNVELQETGTFTNINAQLAQDIYKCVSETKSFIKIHTFAERYFKSNIYLPPILREFLRLVPKVHILAIIKYIDVYLSQTQTKNIFDILHLFFGFVKVLNSTNTSARSKS